MSTHKQVYLYPHDRRSLTMGLAVCRELLDQGIDLSDGVIEALADDATTALERLLSELESRGIELPELD